MMSDGKSLSGLFIDGQKMFAALPENDKKTENEGDTRNVVNLSDESLTVFEETSRWLDIYFGGKEPDFTPPLSMSGTPFRKSVWKILLAIPYGKTVTYGEIAELVAVNSARGKMSAQAVGGAVGHNPISIIVPCHRVVGAGGNLTGYAGGIEKKVKLLALEGVDMTEFFLPKGKLH